MVPLEVFAKLSRLRLRSKSQLRLASLSNFQLRVPGGENASPAVPYLIQRQVNLSCLQTCVYYLWNYTHETNMCHKSNDPLHRRTNVAKIAPLLELLPLLLRYPVICKLLSGATWLKDKSKCSSFDHTKWKVFGLLHHAVYTRFFRMELASVGHVGFSPFNGCSWMLWPGHLWDQP